MASCSYPPSRAQLTPAVTGRWSQPFRINPTNDWTGVHSAVLRGNGDTTVVLHMLSDAGARVLMVPPDSSLVYGSTGSASWSALNLQRSVGSPGGGSSSPSSQPAATEAPLAFALHQSRPNPTRSGALIPFDLPAPAVARLEVFDAQGRRVHRAVGRFTAGHHEWNLVAPTLRLAPGVYTYRLIAGPHRAQRKLVVLP